MKEQQGAARFARPVLAGTAVGILTCAVLMLVLAGLLAAKDIPQGAITPLAVSAAALGSVLGGFVAAKMAKERGWLLGLVCGLLLYLAVLLAGGFSLLRHAGDMGWLVRLAALPGSAMLGGILGVRDGGRHRHR
jgi:putative membrane protein (TIGR04086 family)